MEVNEHFPGWPDPKAQEVLDRMVGRKHYKSVCPKCGSQNVTKQVFEVYENNPQRAYFECSWCSYSYSENIRSR
jgi:formate dehydrogenase maturation protein FdhE